MPSIFARRCLPLGSIVASFLAVSALPLPSQAPPAESATPQMRLVRTVDPASLRLSDRDRLSGGLPHLVPFRIASDKQGRILITDPRLSVIQVLDVEAGKRYQLKSGAAPKMVFPTYIALDDDDDLYVSDPVLGVVLEFFPDGRFARSIGGDELALPFGLAVDKAGRRLFVVDHQRAAVVVYSLEGKFLKSIGSLGTAAGELVHPTDIAYEHGVLYVLDVGNARFEAFDAEGKFKAVLPFGNSRLPLAFTADKDGRLYCVDGLSLGVLVLDPAGNSVATYGARRDYGQPSPADNFPTYTGLTLRGDGAVLGLRPDLAVDVLEFQPGSQGAGRAPKPEKE